ncbi:hypothetical protein FRACYDRAFT_236022 [Fragilariopsis cylindrus CCMP1102]|uniref:Uncharacterized protein n=1 Tax=Fragilariopsis cylindrus CCMP1102 TaxID=635003 RepID=A0A1E7FP84_9STRA|nr:hypothetical protein FRACYDRAFT_236022 [Fragilariopsis cylindrus CCMP1102]|eukprot:OEU19961.1 hypothetical protein FRACYDRAFT_236022 [Fragilariopsis cylindrus CCMP1102]
MNEGMNHARAKIHLTFCGGTEFDHGQIYVLPLRHDHPPGVTQAPLYMPESVFSNANNKMVTQERRSHHNRNTIPLGVEKATTATTATRNMTTCREDLRMNNSIMRMGYPDPLEVTRTTSNSSSMPDSPTSSRLGETTPASSGTISPTITPVFECDYDQNPTVLYQAIEAKQWDYAVSLITNKVNNVDDDNDEHDDDNDEEEPSSTWVVRKELNGKLRWRLLPLHAAVIFGSPLKLVELLLLDYPLAAQCKDDRGMLPLHLAFRNEACWDIIEELLTAYPLAVFMTDRKGRTPLKCVVELYSQIAVSGERKRVEQEARILAQNGLSQVQETHYRQLAKVRSEWEKEKLESKRQKEKIEKENIELQERIKKLNHELELRNEFKNDMTKKMNLMNAALNNANERVKANNPGMHKMESTNKVLRMVTENLVEQQTVYHGRVQDLLTKFKELVAEREKMRSILVKESTDQQQQIDVDLVESFQNWFDEEGLKLAQQAQRSLVIDDDDDDDRPIVSSKAKTTSLLSSSGEIVEEINNNVLLDSTTKIKTSTD